MALRTENSAWPVAAAIMAITGVVTLVIVVGIVLVLVGANSHNMLAGGIHDFGGWLVSPFHDLFPRPQPKLNVLLNWGIAAVVYFVGGSVIARLVR